MKYKKMPEMNLNALEAARARIQKLNLAQIEKILEAVHDYDGFGWGETTKIFNYLTTGTEA